MRLRRLPSLIVDAHNVRDSGHLYDFGDRLSELKLGHNFSGAHRERPFRQHAWTNGDALERETFRAHDALDSAMSRSRLPETAASFQGSRRTRPFSHGPRSEFCRLLPRLLQKACLDSLLRWDRFDQPGLACLRHNLTSKCGAVNDQQLRRS